MDSLEAKAKTIFEQQSKMLTGHVWDWEIASPSVKEKFRQRARDDIGPMTFDQVLDSVANAGGPRL